MRRLLSSIGSALSLLAVLLWFPLGGLLPFYLVVLPVARIRPGLRRASVSAYMKFMSRGIFALLAAGGARYRRTGTIPTGSACLIVMNHQSLLDICTATLMATPYVPAFVTRSRYARFIPLVSACVRLLGCPIIDPKRDRMGAVGVLSRTAPVQEHGVLIFPEGHRSLDGEVRPFKTAGAEAVLAARRMPVYLVVTDGFWAGRRLVDFVVNVHKIRGETEVLGPFEPPESEEAIRDFLLRMRETLVEHLRQMRERRRGSA